MAYVAYENNCFVIRENTGSTRILAGLIIGGTDNFSDFSFESFIESINEYGVNKATYEAINPLWIGDRSYSSDPIGAMAGYVCVWEEYLAGNSDSLSSAHSKLRSSMLLYRRAIVAEGGKKTYAKDFFAHCLPQTQQLDTPTDLTATNVTHNSADLGWSNVENASNYRVDYRIYGDSLWQQTTSN